jgi:hypothetical protein
MGKPDFNSGSLPGPEYGSIPFFMPRRNLLRAVLLGLFFAHARAADPAAEMAAAATAWLQSLEPAQRSQAVFAVGDSERENWNYVPVTRKGVKLGDMTGTQQAQARRLLAAGLSQRGQLQVEAIIALENVLFAIEGSARRNPQLYFFTVFGAPGSPAPWGWRVEGHHLSINFTLADGRISATPTFFGANPAEVRVDHPQKGRRALVEEEDQGRALVKSFDTGQFSAALIADRAPNEIVTENDRQVKPPEPAGLAYARMTPDQQAQLRALVEVYAGRLRPDLAATEMQAIASRGWDHVHFAWAGGREKGEGHYYRIQGPAFLIEYDNTQNRANHIHTTWRNFTGDFGRDLLSEHYRRDHPATR